MKFPSFKYIKYKIKIRNLGLWLPCTIKLRVTYYRQYTGVGDYRPVLSYNVNQKTSCLAFKSKLNMYAFSAKFKNVIYYETRP